MVQIGSRRDSYRRFVEEFGPGLRLALVSAFGPEMGSEATGAALVWGWEHWDRLASTTNPAGQLYRVGARKVPRLRRPRLPSPSEDNVAKKVANALERLPAQQRAVILLVFGFDWSGRQAADATGTKLDTVERDLEQARSHLEQQLELSRVELSASIAVYAPELDEAASPFEELRPRLPLLVTARPPAGPSGRWLLAITAALIVVGVIVLVALLVEFQ